MLILTFLLMGSAFYTPPSSHKISPQVYKWLNSLPQEREVKMWVFFTDKEILDRQEYKKTLERIESSLKPGIKARRLLVRKTGELCDFTDIPVCMKYVTEIRKAGCKLEGISNWLNAAVFRIPVKLVPEIVRKGYVRKIQPVRILCTKLKPMPGKGGIEYGDSKKQLEQINLTSAHLEGYTGKGVRIGILDTGFEWRKHIGLQGIDVIAEYDFINDDTYTAYEDTNIEIIINGDTLDKEYTAQINHGTGMLCLLGGRQTGDYVGAAFNASFALAKTELLCELYPQIGGEDIIMEEHWWIRGAEWLADSVGVDIISNSLGYKQWYDGGNFAYDSLDGKYYPMEIAASLLWAKGVLLVTAMGNLDTITTRPDTCIVAPASADSIITVGGVDTSGNWDDPSIGGIGIPGPRCDGARKPDVCGPLLGWYGLPIYYPNYPRDSVVGGWGTSIATALVAGACACVKEGHPDWGPMKIRTAMRNTASRANSPNDTLGYGIVNAKKAIYYESPVKKDKWDRDKIVGFYPNPFRASQGKLNILYKLVNSSHANIWIYTLSGKPVWNCRVGCEVMGEHTLEWNGKTSKGNLIASGVYICYLETGYGYDVKKFAVVR